MARSRRLRPAAFGAGILALLLVAGLAVSAIVRGPDRPTYRTDTVRIEGTREPDGRPVTLAGDLYLPLGAGRHPAVLLAHGWGSNRQSLAAQARSLVARGLVVLAYDARGHGGSGGKIHLDSPDYEVKDAELMLDDLAARPQVQLDRAGDPRVGVAGGSYGGALALMLAGSDPRVDAVVPSITWHDLRQALFPQFAVTGPSTGPATATPIATTGVFKKQWAAVLLGSAAAQGPPGQGAPGTGAPGTGAPTGPPGQGAGSGRALGLETLGAACGTLAADLCLGYVQAATTGRPSAALLDLLARSSPARVVGRITAPTLLIQGQADSLFPLSEGDANARAIAANGTPVQVVWQAGGHDGGTDEGDRLTELSGRFLQRTLTAADPKAAVGASLPWQVTVPDAAVSTTDTQAAPQLREAPAYGRPREDRFPLSGAQQQLVVSPPGATPAALTSLPGLSSVLGTLGSASRGAALPGAAGLDLARLPGQTATFTTAPLSRPVTITGAGRVSVRISSTAKDATLFASLVDVGPDGRSTLPEQLVAPVRLENLPARGRQATIALPAVVRDVPAGHRLQVVLSSTDQAYALPVDARGYRISLAGPELTVPAVVLTTEQDGAGLAGLLRPALLVLALVVLLVAGFTVRARRARSRTGAVEDGLVTVPLAIEGLGKAYGDGFRAVSDLTFRVEAGQVLGLLGPNGAGKTTMLRMLMGLIHPSEGEIRVFGQLVTPGAPVLSRLGSFVEGPGFLPHLSGLDNLQLYWRATGRPAGDAAFDVALEIAGLGDDVRRKVRTYSQGMRQRLAIAQAMLGLPDLLVLDEPTNGLDPPQIREMREVLGRYAATGRTVVVSSHLLAEVEQTCSDVVVMHQGRLVAQAPVAQLAGTSTRTLVDVDEPARAAGLARDVPGVTGVEEVPGGLVLQADGPTRATLVTALAGAGLKVERVAPQRGLEETFLHLVGEE